MKHLHAVQILEAIAKDSKFFLGFVSGRRGFPIVIERHNVYHLLRDLSDIREDGVLETLETLFKDSKIFQGIALARGCHPFALNAGKTRNLFDELALAVLDVPQDDMFATHYRGGKSPLTVYRCPLCDTQQPATGFSQGCTGCGVVRKTAYTPAMVRDAIVGVNDAIPLEMISPWSVEQLEEAIIWARECVEADTSPPMPAHIKEAYDQLNDAAMIKTAANPNFNWDESEESDEADDAPEDNTDETENEN